MAFIKRNWLARIGIGLNKFIIGDKDGEGKQTLTNSPDSVTQQGDVISADNLNDLEDRIDSAINGLYLVKIWENIAPSVDFSAQLIYPDFSKGGLDDFVIEYLLEKNQTTSFFKHVKNNDPSAEQYSGSISETFVQSATLAIYGRGFQCNRDDEEISIGVGRTWVSSTISQDNSKLIPLAIWAVVDPYIE